MAFNHKHLIDITEYSADDIMTVLETAVRFKEVNERRIKQVPTLKGVTVVNMFNEPSTRTRSSFEIAEKRLSANSLNFGGSSTSTVKGESLVDTVETLCAYKIDMIIVRDKHAGVPRKIADVSGAHVIDAGDGKHQHPTQALLDLYSIWEVKGDLNGLKVGVVGDIGHSRARGLGNGIATGDQLVAGLDADRGLRAGASDRGLLSLASLALHLALVGGMVGAILGLGGRAFAFEAAARVAAGADLRALLGALLTDGAGAPAV